MFLQAKSLDFYRKSEVKVESWEQGNPVKKGLGVSERTPVKKEVIHLMEQIGDINT